MQYLKTLNFEEIVERSASALSRPKEKAKGGGKGRGEERRVRGEGRGGREEGDGGEGMEEGGSHAPSRLFPATQKLYKCMQRSWTNGIILTDLVFRDDRFDVKLFTLENSRLNVSTTAYPEVCD